MKTRKPKPLSDIDLNAPGGLEDLFSFHRNIFGDATMEDDGDKDAADKDAADKDAADKAAADKAAEDEDKDLPEGLGDAGKRAIKAERQKAKEAIAEANDAKRKLREREDKDLTDAQKTARDLEERTNENEKLRKENLRLSALSKHPVPEKYHYLVTGDDEASFLKSAQDIAEMASGKGGSQDDPKNRPGYVPGSGSGSGGEGGGGLVAAGRDRYKNSKKK